MPRLDADGRPALVQPWRLAVLIMAAVNLAAFWFLLQYRYSSRNYHTTPTDLGSVERVWIGVSICAAVAVGVSSWRNVDAARRLVRAGLAATAVAGVVLVEVSAGSALRSLDAILFSVAWAWAMVFWLRPNHALNPHQTLALRLGSRIWRPEIVNVLATVVWTAAAGLFFYYMRQQIRYLNSLALGYADCGENARLMFNTLRNPRELFLRVNPDKPLFYDHVNLGILPLIPLWFLWPDIKLTILLQVLGVLGCVVPIYWIGRELLRDTTAALLLVAAWLVFPSTSLFIYSASEGFRWGNLCLLLYFLALVCWIKDRPGTALLFAVWAILIKEEAAIPIGTFGLYLAFFERRRWLGAVIVTAAFAYFLLVTSIVIPSMSHQGYVMQRFFSDLGATKWDVLLSPWTKPRIFWGKILSPSTFYFVALLLAPLLFIPLRRPSILFVGSLVFLFDCLHPILKSINYQYQAALLPVVFWALVEALRTGDTVRQRATLSGAVVSGILLSLFFGNTFWSETPLLILPPPNRLHLIRQMGRHIDRSRSLFATQRVAAHFITQKYLYLDPPVPSSIDYALLDLRDSWLETPDVRWIGKLRAIQRQVEANPNLYLVDVNDGLLLYARHGVPIDRRALVERDALPSEATVTNLDLASGAKIIGYKVDPMESLKEDPRVGVVRVTIFSAVTMPTNTDLAVRCVLRPRAVNAQEDEILSKLQPLGQGIWPIARWLPGKVYSDYFLINLAAEMSKEQFSVSFAAVPIYD